MIPILYRGSVKNVLGPVEAGKRGPFVVFEYSDAYSVFDWGRMPDALPGKGEALAMIAAYFFEQLEQPETWKEFSKSSVALGLRRGNRSGSVFNELGEKLQADGLRTHYFGLLEQPEKSIKPVVTGEIRKPAKHMMVKQVSAVPPRMVSVLGQAMWDYSETIKSPAPRLVPLEVVFRFGVPEGSSLLERAPAMGLKIEAGHRWEFPYLEVFSKLETTDRLLTLPEALALSGVSAEQLQEVLYKTAWVAGYLKWVCEREGLELADGKLEWGVSDRGEVWLVDAIGPDELRILKDGVQLSKEFLRGFYRPTAWYSAIKEGKAQAAQQGSADWKRLVSLKPEALSPAYREVATQLYPALANALTDKKWFPDAMDLSQVIQAMLSLEGQG